MRRRFNYTGRKPIHRSAVRISLTDEGGGVPSFVAKIDLSEVRVPGHSRVFVEAYHHASYMRFDYGQVSDLRPPSDCRLTEIERGATPLFRVKVIDLTTDTGRVLAVVDAISPLDADQLAANRQPILPVVKADLGHEVWRVKFDTIDDRPVLELNKNIEGIERLAMGDDRFMALVYPNVVRQMLYRILVVEDYADLDGPDDDWRCQWLRFTCALPGVMPPPERGDEENQSSRYDGLEWIEEAVRRFCDRHKYAERFIRPCELEGAR